MLVCTLGGCVLVADFEDASLLSVRTLGSGTSDCTSDEEMQGRPNCGAMFLNTSDTGLLVCTSDGGGEVVQYWVGGE